MNEAPDPLDPTAQKAMAVVAESRDAIFASWRKARTITGKTDLIAIVEPLEKEISILILPRITGLSYLSERGCDTTHPSLERLTEAASGMTPEATAIWVVVHLDEKITVAKMVNQPMTQGGSA